MKGREGFFKDARAPARVSAIVPRCLPIRCDARSALSFPSSFLGECEVLCIYFDPARSICQVMFRNLSRLIHSTCSSNQILIKKKLAIASSCLKGSISQKFQHERGWSVFDVCVAITSAGRSQQRSHSSSSQDRKDNNTSWPSRSTLLIVAIGACTIGSYINIRFHLANENSAASVKIGPPVGSPTLGGPFQLIDHHKKAMFIYSS